MKAIRKVICPFLFMSFSVCTGIAQSPLYKLPYDINIGVTKNQEIEGKGVCVAKIKKSDSSFKCARYNMGDKFYAYSNVDEVVTKISFLSVSHHVLPQNWLALGLRLASSYRYRKIKTTNELNPKTQENEGGNSQKEFIDIITANGATNITRNLSYSSDYQIGEVISFVIGKLHYDAEFIKWVKPKWCENCPTYTDYDNGLVSIEVIESY